MRASGADRGPYGCAVVLYWDAGVGHQEAVYLGDHGTVNEAEYEGLLLGLRLARSLQVTHLSLRCDSMLIVEQVLGSWAVKALHLQPLCDEARKLAASFEEIKIKHVPREENAVADALCTAMLDEATGRARGASRRVLVYA